jgi:hypothetical protein
MAVAYKVSKAEAVNSPVQGEFPTGAALVDAIEESEPELAVSITDTPAEGEYGVCSDSDAQTMKLVGRSKSGTMFLLRAPTDGDLEIEPGECGAVQASLDCSNPAWGDHKSMCHTVTVRDAMMSSLRRQRDPLWR